MIDITDRIGQLRGSMCFSPAWPMYSFDAPSYAVWNEIANVLSERGWPETKIKAWLQSKNARWAMDGDLGDALREAATKFAKNIQEE